MQNADQQECWQWATNQTNHDPSAPPAPVVVSNQGSDRKVLKGATAGAVVGGIGGSLGGEFGKGAAAGAAIGALTGGIKKSRGDNAAAQAEAQAQQARAAQDETFYRAYTACLEGKGYTVK